MPVILDIRAPRDLKQGAAFIEGSILDRPQLPEIFRGCDCIVHIPAWHGIHEAHGGSLLGQAAPGTTLGVIWLGAAFLFGRGTGHVGLFRCLKWALAIRGTAQVAGVSYWAFGLADQIMTDIYQAQHHYQLAKATIIAGIALPQGSWVFADEEGRLYEIDTKAGARVSIDGALWQGEIRLIPEAARTASDREIIKSATLAADAVIQGTPCRTGKLVEFTEYGGDLLRCTLAWRTVVVAEIADAGGEEIVLSGDGLDTCSLAAAQRVGPFDLATGTRVRFAGRWLREIQMPLTSASLAMSGLDLPPSTTVALCDRSREIDYLLVPDDRYVAIADVKLTGRMNFDCGRFRYGSLFENTFLRGRLLPRHALVSPEDVFGTSARCRSVGKPPEQSHVGESPPDFTIARVPHGLYPRPRRHTCRKPPGSAALSH